MEVKKIIGSVSNGKFISKKLAALNVNNREHIGHRQYVRDRMRETYLRDIQQPYKGNQPNPGYIEAFGKQNAINEGLVEAPKYE